MSSTQETLFRSLPPTGAKNVTWKDWELLMFVTGTERNRAIMASIAGKMLAIVDMMPNKGDRDVTSTVHDMMDDPIFDEVRDLFRRLPVEFRPITFDQANLVLIALRFNSAMLLPNRGQPH